MKYNFPIHLSFLTFFSLSNSQEFSNCNPEDYYQGFNPESFSSTVELKQTLHDYIKDHNVIAYFDTTAALRVLDAYPENPSQVLGVYSLLPKSTYPSEWNKEHLWPRSRGIGDSGPDYSDLHNLRACDATLNSLRQNKYYDECEVGTDACKSPAGTASEDAAEGSMQDVEVWAPPPETRGQLARAIFYMAVRYDGSDSATYDLEVVECSSGSTCGPTEFGRLSTLLRWHLENPVTEEEITRNTLVCSDFQGNRNPFVDYPELVETIFGPFPDSSCADNDPSGLVWSDTGESAACSELSGHCQLQVVVESCPSTCNRCDVVALNLAEVKTNNNLNEGFLPHSLQIGVSVAIGVLLGVLFTLFVLYKNPRKPKAGPSFGQTHEGKELATQKENKEASL